MTWTGTDFMGGTNHDLRGRLSAFLYSQYPSERASRLARDIECDPKTAQNILEQHWPNARCWQAIVRRWGRDVVEAVFAPDIEETLARALAEERELEERLEAARARRRQVAGGRDPLSNGAEATVGVGAWPAADLAPTYGRRRGDCALRSAVVVAPTVGASP